VNNNNRMVVLRDHLLDVVHKLPSHHHRPLPQSPRRILCVVHAIVTGMTPKFCCAMALVVVAGILIV
jgi:hypothetical protein